MNTKPIREFIVQSEENLRIAEAVSEALPDARHMLAVAFLTRLDVRLKAGLPRWRSKNDQLFFSGRWATYSFWKPEWADQYALALQFAEYGAEMVFGVIRVKEKIGNRPFSHELLSAIKAMEIYRQPETLPDWEAHIRMDSPAENWRKPEILWRMYKVESFLNDVAEQLLDLAKISEPIVDKIVRQYNK